MREYKYNIHMYISKKFSCLQMHTIAYDEDNNINIYNFSVDNLKFKL